MKIVLALLGFMSIALTASAQDFPAPKPGELQSARRVATKYFDDIVAADSNVEISQQIKTLKAAGYVQVDEHSQVDSDCGYFGATGFASCYFKVSIKVVFHRAGHFARYLNAIVSVDNMGRVILSSVLPQVTPADDPTFLEGTYTYANSYEITNAYEVYRFTKDGEPLSEKQLKYIEDLKASGLTCHINQSEPSRPFVKCLKKLDPSDLKLQDLAERTAILKFSIHFYCWAGVASIKTDDGILYPMDNCLQIASEDKYGRDYFSYQGREGADFSLLAFRYTAKVNGEMVLSREDSQKEFSLSPFLNVTYNDPDLIRIAFSRNSGAENLLPEESGGADPDSIKYRIFDVSYKLIKSDP
jgi:hypothetical protein